MSADTQPADMDAPDLPYKPPVPAGPVPGIGVIGTGGISDAHLDAYARVGWPVRALWNRTRATAEAKAATYFPDAKVAEDWRHILDDPDIGVVDITLHPEHRTEITRAALLAGKHVLSQKPFVTDLDVGADLVALAQDKGVQLAVNQNGRWAPHLAYMREAVRAGLIGSPVTAHLSVHWDHGWTAGTPFDAIDDLILYDFGVHWFDFMTSIFGERIEAVTASATRARGQANKVPLLAQAMLKVADGQGSIVFDGARAHGPRDTTYIGGSDGAVCSDGPDLGQQSVTLTTADGVANPTLEGQWFNDGFAGTMGALICAVETGQPPLNSAADNLRSLALTFAAVRSRITGREVAVGAVRRLES